MPVAWLLIMKHADSVNDYQRHELENRKGSQFKLSTFVSPLIKTVFLGCNRRGGVPNRRTKSQSVALPNGQTVQSARFP